MSNELLIIQEAQPTALIKVVDEITREQAVNRVILLKKGRIGVIAYWEKLRKMTILLQKTTKEQEDEMLTVYDNAILAQVDEEKVYLREEERKRKEANEKAAEESRKREADERVRIETEQKKAIEDGNIEKAVELEDKPVQAHTAAKVAPLPQKTFKADAGTASANKDVFVEAIDLKAFFKYCAENDLSELWDMKLGAVKTLVKNKGLKEVPGLRIYEDFVISHRPAR